MSVFFVFWVSLALTLFKHGLCFVCITLPCRLFVCLTAALFGPVGSGLFCVLLLHGSSPRQGSAHGHGDVGPTGVG